MAKKVFTKDIILKTAYELAFNRGIEHISMRSIAKELGCSVMPIYEAFDSKEDLINALSTFNEEDYMQTTHTMYDRYYRLLREGIKYPNFFLSVVEYDVHKLHNETIIDFVCELVQKQEDLQYLSNRTAYIFNTRIELFIVGMVYAYRTMPADAKTFARLKPILDNAIESFIQTFKAYRN